MNTIRLLEMIKNQIDYSTFQAIQSDFFDSFNNEYGKISTCKSARERAIKRYISNATHKDQRPGTYTNGKTALLIRQDYNDIEPKNIQTTDLGKLITDMWKNKRPTHCYFFDCVALYKTLKKQESLEYLLPIDGHYYNIALVAEMLECIADSKEAYVSAEICENGALLLKQKYAALVLPVMRSGLPITHNVNMQDFLKYINDIEKSFIEDIKKSA